MKKYYEVIAKAGHVGRNSYTEISLYIISETKKEAAAKARWTPRVKHHDKQAILEVKEISYENYCEGNKKNSENPFFKAKNIQEQRALCNDLEIKSSINLQNCKIDRSKRKRLSERNFPKYQKYCDYIKPNEYFYELCTA